MGLTLNDIAYFYHNNLYENIPHEYAQYLDKLFGKMDREIVDEFELGYVGYNYLTNRFKETYSDTSSLMVHDLIRLNDGKLYDYFNDRLMYPIKDINGNVLGFTGRTIKEGSSAKYLLSSGTSGFRKSKVLYNIDKAHEYSKSHETKILYIVEGVTDCIAMYMKGIKNTVALLGTTLSASQALLISTVGWTHAIVILDGDSAGYQASGRIYKMLKSMGILVRFIFLPDNMDPYEYLIAKNNFFESLKATNFGDYKIKPYFNKIYDDGLDQVRKLKMFDRVIPYLTFCSTEMKEKFVYTTANRLNVTAEAVVNDIDMRIRGFKEELSYYQGYKGGK